MAPVNGISVGDRVIVLIRNGKREHGNILKALSEVHYIIRLDNGKDVERHINHVWKGGTNIPAQCQVENDTYTYTDFNSGLSPKPAVVPAIVPAAEEPPTPLRTQSPDNRGHEAPVDVTPRRSTRTWVPSRRLKMDLNAKSYGER